MEAPPIDRKLIAILAADAVGYSRLMEADETGALAALTERRTIIDGIIARYRGRIANTAGDSVLAEFGSVFDAVQCAVDIQSALADADAQLPDAQRMKFRIGINVGDVMIKDGDIFGDGVNIAARLQMLAEPGTICISRGVRDHIRRKLPYGFVDLGEQHVKNIAQPIRVFSIVPEGPPPDDPPILEATTVAEGPPAPLMETSSAVDPKTIELAFWDTVQNSEQLEDFRVYLERYPEGEFAALARARLSGDSLLHVDPQERAVEMAFWDSVQDSDDSAMLEAYLEKYPEGEFKSLAEIQLANLQRRSNR